MELCMIKQVNTNKTHELNATRDKTIGLNVGVGLIPSKSIFDGRIIDTLKIEDRLFEVTFQEGIWYACTGHNKETQTVTWEILENVDAIHEIIESTQDGMHYANKYFGIFSGFTIH